MYAPFLPPLGGSTRPTVAYSRASSRKPVVCKPAAVNDRFFDFDDIGVVGRILTLSYKDLKKKSRQKIEDWNKVTASVPSTLIIFEDLQIGAFFLTP